jgi:hypothetical protein
MKKYLENSLRTGQHQFARQLPIASGSNIQSQEYLTMNGNQYQYPRQSKCDDSAQRLLELERWRENPSRHAHHLGCQPRPVSRLLHPFTWRPMHLSQSFETPSLYDKSTGYDLFNTYDNNKDSI